MSFRFFFFFKTASLLITLHLLVYYKLQNKLLPKPLFLLNLFTSLKLENELNRMKESEFFLSHSISKKKICCEKVKNGNFEA